MKAITQNEKTEKKRRSVRLRKSEKMFSKRVKFF